MESSLVRHRGLELAISTEGGRVRALSIDGKDVDVTEIVPGVFATMSIPYRNFGSVEELARAVVDGSPQFARRRDVHT